jgi:hypothetical protein
MRKSHSDDIAAAARRARDWRRISNMLGIPPSEDDGAATAAEIHARGGEDEEDKFDPDHFARELAHLQGRSPFDADDPAHPEHRKRPSEAAISFVPVTTGAADFTTRLAEVRSEIMEQLGVALARIGALEKSMGVRRSAPRSWICAKQAASIAGVSPETIRQWISVGAISGDIFSGQYLCSPSSLQQHLAKRNKRKAQ